MNFAKRVNIDKVGAFASAACAVHCLLTGIALGLLSVLGLGFIGSTLADVVFMTVTLSVASVAIFTGIRRHGSFVPATLFGLGVISIIVSHFVLDHESKDLVTRLVTTIFAVGGGVLLVAFHVVNLKLQKDCRHRGDGRHDVSGDFNPSTKPMPLA